MKEGTKVFIIATTAIVGFLSIIGLVLYLDYIDNKEARHRIEQMQCPDGMLATTFNMPSNYGDPSTHVVCYTDGKFTVK